MTIVFDRIASVGGWIHAVDERDLGTELPLRTEDFNLEVNIMLYRFGTFLTVFSASCPEQSAGSGYSRCLYPTPSSIHRLFPSSHKGSDDVREGHGLQRSG